MKVFTKIIFYLVFFSACLVQVAPAVAQTDAGSAFIPQCVLDTPNSSEASRNCDNINTFLWLGIRVARWVLSFIGALALLFFVYGGFIMILSQGNQEKIKQGTGAMTAAVIGLVIAFSAYALVKFVGDTIGLTGYSI
jgi:hypothetical protein